METNVVLCDYQPIGAGKIRCNRCGHVQRVKCASDDFFCRHHRRHHPLTAEIS